MSTETSSARYDYIIVGAGSSGSALAARLSENPDVAVLVLEAGKASHPLSFLPASYGLFLNHPEINWRYRSAPEPGTCDRTIPVPRGKIVGGSSEINGLVYVRGQPQDYDRWAELGNPGWSWKDVAPVFRRMESYSGGDPEIRGLDGPIALEEVAEDNPLYDAIFSAAARLGYGRNADYNGLDQEGIAFSQASIRRGIRMSTRRAYLRPAIRRPNLNVLPDAMASRLIVERGRCTGVRYRRGSVQFEELARREVIVCAGAINTPQLLELSGIGAPEILKAAGIDVVHALPAVGQYLRDHLAGRLRYKLRVPGLSFNDRLRGLRAIGEVLKYALNGSGFFGQPAAVILAFLRSSPVCVSPDLQLSFAPLVVKSSKRRQLETFPGITAAICQLRPESFGSVHIRSSEIDEHPAIKFNFLSHLTDQKAIVDGLRIARSIIRTSPLNDFCGEELTPGAAVSTDDEILGWMRQHAETMFHPVGTCRMGPDRDAVVDAKLRVHGLRGLRIADASIMPTIPSGNTNAPAIMIGEMAADFLRQTSPPDVPNVASEPLPPSTTVPA